MPTTLVFTGGATLDVAEPRERVRELLADGATVIDLTIPGDEPDVVHVQVPAIAWWRSSSERVRPRMEVWQ